MSDNDKSQENRLRLMAQRRGFRLVKSQRRDPQAPELGQYMIVDAVRNVAVAGRIDSRDALSLKQVEEWLSRLDSSEDARGPGTRGTR